MKIILFLTFLIPYISTNGQIEYNGVKYNKMTPVMGTNYVIATFKDSSKKAIYNNHLLFINTSTNQKNKIDFPSNVYFDKIEQVKIDNLGINKILIVAKTDYVGKDRFIDLRERPTKILILSPDGQEKTQLTADSLFVSSWEINNQNGSIFIRGYYDTNKNGKNDKADKSEELLFDLKTLMVKLNR